MITNRTRLVKYLEEEPRARERKYKDRALVNVLLKHSDSGAIHSVPKDVLIDFCHDFINYDRLWRLVLAEQPELRGADYDDKTVLAQEKVLELGYEVGNRKLKI